MINKKITKSDLAVVASVIFFSSVLFGNNVSFGDTTQPPSKAQIAKQQAQLKAETEYSNSVAVAKVQYSKAKNALNKNTK